METLAEKCSECGKCIAICPFLAKTGKTPAVIAKQGAEVMEAFSCSLCGACEAVCPLGLSPKNMFAGRRNAAVENGEIDIDEYRYLFPDRPNNVMNMYRRFYGVHYDGIENVGSAGTWFFPGCTLLTYSPNLTREVYRRLQTDCNCQGMWTECCGKPLVQLGIQHRADAIEKRLKEFVEAHQISRIITACPGCYYELKNVFASLAVRIQTVYEVLNFAVHKKSQNIKCTIHDACPDRFELKFAGQVRRALEQNGFSIIEMQHSKGEAICCGSGGQISHFNPDLTEELVQTRLKEARQADADILVGYCLSCVLKFDNADSPVTVTHALQLLLDQPKDFNGAKTRVAAMLNGADGEKIWDKIMAEESCPKETK
ncbi:(Fe-S)-binding protein [Sporomusa acidovorans]|uniref:Lactate utilization protein A n=1 Tax=Sporomusa acidovorans (strain ATCC 49682 / DSM 3132 / Mol) TaxID=1123286 RepID=A0ABZ3IYR1_SPOA4|nr:(Fe-S)-binding protein [Sporomusa acidovorans]OZC14199.1 lactate utilization protein A [Sporomusa acidovorans DSM 3132]SDE71019.1 Fe-S oxidoreductase [Sporomusa acidovorans]